MFRYEEEGEGGREGGREGYVRTLTLKCCKRDRTKDSSSCG